MAVIKHVACDTTVLEPLRAALLGLLGVCQRPGPLRELREGRLQYLTQYARL